MSYKKHLDPTNWEIFYSNRDSEHPNGYKRTEIRSPYDNICTFEGSKDEQNTNALLLLNALKEIKTI